MTKDEVSAFVIAMIEAGSHPSHREDRLCRRRASRSDRQRSLPTDRACFLSIWRARPSQGGYHRLPSWDRAGDRDPRGPDPNLIWVVRL